MQTSPPEFSSFVMNSAMNAQRAARPRIWFHFHALIFLQQLSSQD
jgi:hypothetical protein